MHSILKAAVKINSLRCLINPLKSAINTNQRLIARNVWYMCGSNNAAKVNTVGVKLLDGTCSCGCGKRGVHSKAEKELVEFLTEEILAERKVQKAKTIPTELEGFKATLNGAEVTLTKTVDDETIKISFNVNHSVDSDTEPEVNPQMDKPQLGELKSKPSFRIELIRGNTTVSLLCSFVNPDEQDESYSDIFGIDEISIYEGEWNENVYAVSGEVVDSYLYDLLLNYLEEKGISNDFVEKLSNYATTYEQSAYISLLEGLSKFASGK